MVDTSQKAPYLFDFMDRIVGVSWGGGPWCAVIGIADETEGLKVNGFIEVDFTAIEGGTPGYTLFNNQQVPPTISTISRKTVAENDLSSHLRTKAGLTMQAFPVGDVEAGPRLVGGVFFKCTGLFSKAFTITVTSEKDAAEIGLGYAVYIWGKFAVGQQINVNFGDVGFSPVLTPAATQKVQAVLTGGFGAEAHTFAVDPVNVALAQTS